MTDDERICGEESPGDPGYHCELHPGHDGRHFAAIDGYLAWPRAPRCERRVAYPLLEPCGEPLPCPEHGGADRVLTAHWVLQNRETGFWTREPDPARGDKDGTPGAPWTLRAWLDEDGKHVWTAHDCTTGRLLTMLPTTWRATPDGAVAPSFDCHACGLHRLFRVEWRAIRTPVTAGVADD